MSLSQVLTQDSCICCKIGDSDTFKIGYTNDMSRRILELNEQRIFARSSQIHQI
nr:MAG TPA: hypothetical protein [Caudoviricetes sp.]